MTAPLETERLLVRPYRSTDIEDLYPIHSSAEVVRYLYWEVRSRAEVEQSVASALTSNRIENDDDAIRLVVERRDDGRVIGSVTLWVRSMHHRQGEIGFVFSPDVQGRGYATEASRAVLALAFGPMGLHRVCGRADARNDSSAALMRRLGMRQEAHLRHNEIFKGDWADEVIFAMLEDEWGTGADAAAVEA